MCFKLILPHGSFDAVCPLQRYVTILLTLDLHSEDGGVISLARRTVGRLKFRRPASPSPSISIHLIRHELPPNSQPGRNVGLRRPAPAPT
jgi:hypothetical protein